MLRVTDFRSHAATLRRRVRVLVAAAVVGLAAGVAYVVVEPTPLTSTTLVLLPTPALADSSNSDVDHPGAHRPERQHLGAGRQGGRSGSSAAQGREDGQGLGGDEPAHPDRRDLDQRRRRRRRCRRPLPTPTSTTSATPPGRSPPPPLTDLTNRRDDLQTQIKQLQKEIAATTKRQQAADPDSPEGREEAQLLAGLRTQQANLALQLDKVEDKIAAGTPVGSSATGTLVVQQATVAEGPSTLMRLLIWAPARCPGRHPARGRLVLATAHRDHAGPTARRHRRRHREPGAGGVRRAGRKRSVAGWSALLETYQATPVESWALRQVLRGLVPRPKGQSRIAGRAGPSAVADGGVALR